MTATPAAAGAATGQARICCRGWAAVAAAAPAAAPWPGRRRRSPPRTQWLLRGPRRQQPRSAAASCSPAWARRRRPAPSSCSVTAPPTIPTAGIPDRQRLHPTKLRGRVHHGRMRRQQGGLLGKRRRRFSPAATVYQRAWFDHGRGQRRRCASVNAGVGGNGGNNGLFFGNGGAGGAGVNALSPPVWNRRRGAAAATQGLFARFGLRQ